MNSVKIRYTDDKDQVHYIPMDKVLRVYGTMQDLQAVTVIEKKNGSKIVLVWNRSVYFTKD